MTKKRNKSNSKYLKLCAIFMFPFALFGGVALAKTPNVEAAETYVRYKHEILSITNSSFVQGGTPFVKGDSLSGWNAIETESRATGMLIDVGSGSNTEEGNDETTTFSKNKEEYMLSQNPGAHGNDSRILMINSKENKEQKNVKAYKGYRSSSITLEANSYYVFSVSAKVMLNGDDFANGSIYINGLVDKDEKSIKLGYENFSNTTWQEYYFFVATGNKSQTVTLDLYLGSNGGQTRSEGAVFFDNVNATRYSHNMFMELCQDYGYNNEDNLLIEYSDKDNWTNNNLNSAFLIDALQPEFYIFEGTEGYNFDFEDDIPANTDTLGQHWQIITGGRANGSARIVDIRNMQQRDFKDLTGYDYIGDTLTYNNNQALVLWTDSNEYSSGGYIGVKSEDILVEAHSILKVSLKMKVAGMKTGSFYLKVNENDSIYSYSNLSSDSEAKNYYELQNGKTSGITSNVTNAWINDYQNVEFYIKGHNLYNTNVNLELWLGDNQTAAEGCVVIDDIKIEREIYSNFSGASNQLEFKWNDGSSETITNPSFNKSENADDEGKYPVAASGWTTKKEKDDKDLNESGILYLADNKEYDRLYKGKYAWAGINPNATSNPNNVYMMFNSKNSFQSITSSSTTINNNSYYKLSFDYYNQNFGSLESSKIKVEVIDEHGIVLFTKDAVQSLDKWSNMEIYIHTPETVTHSVQVKVSLGDEDNKVGGIVYLDNFSLTTDATFEEKFSSAVNKTELGSFYLNLENGAFSGVKTSPAYTLNIDHVYDSNYDKDNCGTIAGIAYGKENGYGIENDNNLLVITNVVACSSTLQSAYNMSVSADSYYELSFDLATIFGDKAGTSNKDHKCKYGVKVTIDGYEAIENLIATEELHTYKVYIQAKAAATPKIAFSLVSDCDNTTGSAIITNLDFKSVDEYTFANVSQAPGFEKTVFKANESDKVDEDDKDDDTDTDETSPSQADSNLWILIPSLIMSLALIIAIIGFALRKVKIKKIDRIKKETYDRKKSVNHDLILAAAQKKKDAEVADLQKAKDRLLEDKQELENEHKEYFKSQREENEGKLTRAMEAEFKKYNANITRLDQKINIIKEKIDYCMSAEYLLSIESKLAMEEDERLTAEQRERKAQAKLLKKENKMKEKENKTKNKEEK